MGASHSVELMCEQDSSQPGIISGPLDALDTPVTSKEAFDETLALLRYPLDPISEGLKKELIITELDAKTFVMKLILDGKKLDSFGYGKGDGTDRVRHWKKVTMIPEKLQIKLVDYVPEALLGEWVTEAKEEPLSFCMWEQFRSFAKIGIHSTDMKRLGLFIVPFWFSTEINFLQDPPQIEFCIDDKDGNRLANPETRDGLYSWSDTIVQNVVSFKNAKVKMTPDAGSIKEKGLKSMVSEPMDEHVSYDNFFPQMVKFTRDFLAQIPGIDLEETESEIRGKVTNEQGEVTKHLVKFNQDAGEMIVTISHQDKVRTELHRVVHQGPMVLEAWDLDAEGHRLTGAAKAKEIQKNMNIMIDKANSWW